MLNESIIHFNSAPDLTLDSLIKVFSFYLFKFNSNYFLASYPLRVVAPIAYYLDRVHSSCSTAACHYTHTIIAWFGYKCRLLLCTSIVLGIALALLVTRGGTIIHLKSHSPVLGESKRVASLRYTSILQWDRINYCSSLFFDHPSANTLLVLYRYRYKYRGISERPFQTWLPFATI